MSSHPQNSGFEKAFQLWILLCSGIISIGWIFSFFGMLNYSVWASSLLALGVLCFAFRRCLNQSSFQPLPPSLPLVSPYGSGIRRSSPEQPHAPVVSLSAFQLFTFPPFVFLLFLICLAAILYPPTVHDSLSYRLPRILIWLQEGSIAHVPVTDDRINYMTHNWELVTLPLFGLSGDNFLELPNIVSYILLYLLMFEWAGRFTEGRKRLWLAILPAAGFLPVLQACRTSNDLFALVFVLLSAHFMLLACERRKVSDVLWSVLALAIATGTKPHYLVLTLPWLICFLICFPWMQLLRPLVVCLALSSPFLLMCSPILAFWMNHQTYGSVLGPVEDSQLTAGNPFHKVAASTAMVGSQIFQLPINPFASKWNSFWEQNARRSGLSEKLPKFSLSTTEVPIVDSASLGFPVSILFLIGYWIAIRNRRGFPKWTWIFACVGIFAFFVAASQVLPSTIGRSFAGMLFLAIPPAMAGLSRLPIRILSVLSFMVVVSAAFVLAFTPSNPLWPASHLSKVVPGNMQHRFESYLNFSKRYEVGGTLVESIPPDADLLVATGGGEPLLQLWKPYRGQRKVTFLPKGSSFSSASNSTERYLLVSGLAHQKHLDFANAELAAANYGWAMVKSDLFVSRLRDGKQKWLLFERDLEKKAVEQ